MSTVIRSIEMLPGGMLSGGMFSSLARIAFICWLACLSLALLGWAMWIVAHVGMQGIRNFPVRRGAALVVSEN